MNGEMSEKEIYEQAVKHVKEKKDFFIHLLTYIVVNTSIFLVWMISGGGYPWFIWPLFGWGIGLIFHFLSVWVFERQTNWERREIDREVQRLKKK